MTAPPVLGKFTAQLVVDTRHGTLALNPDGSFTYLADGGYVGADFSYYRAYNGSPAGEVTRVDLDVRRAPAIAHQLDHQEQVWLPAPRSQHTRR